MNYSFYTAGTFNRRIVIEQQEAVSDNFGQAQYGEQAAEGNWVPFIECWALISPTYGIEMERSGRDISELTVQIAIRYGSSIGVTRAMRVRDKASGIIYNITAVMPVDWNKKVTELNAVQVQ
jgi:SPP1 family predicted phage head-tail adaptor